MSHAIRALLVLLAAVIPPVAARADASADCFGADHGRRIEACTEFLESAPETPPAQRAMAFALRALAHSVRGDYGSALPDYDSAIEIDPDFAVALNNRAWTNYKLGRITEGLSDIERALALAPSSSHAYDTRAHLRQASGRPAGALADYERAISAGGSQVIKLYQCGMQAQGFFNGEIDGIYTSAFRTALETCAYRADCDPLPPDEECRKLTS